MLSTAAPPSLAGFAGASSAIGTTVGLLPGGGGGTSGAPSSSPVAGNGSLKGTVVDSSGAGVPNATVTLFAGPVPQPLTNTAAGFGIGLPLTTQTDSNGNFSLDTVPVGNYAGIAGAPGVGKATFNTTITLNQTSNVKITLQSQPATAVGSVQGTVTDANGQPVAGANVQLVPPFPVPVDGLTGGATTNPSSSSSSVASTIASFWPIGLHATTDASGKYTIDKVTVGQYQALASSADSGFGRTSVTITENQTATADIMVQKIIVPPPVTGTAVVSGNVKDSTGAPAADVTVTLVPSVVGILNGLAGGSGSSGGIGGTNIAFPGVKATTDASGNYTLSNVPAGSYIVLAYSSTLGTGRTNVTVADGQTVTADITLTAFPVVQTGSLGGTVKDGSGNPVSGADVALLPAITPVAGAGGTGASGSASSIASSTSGIAIFGFPIPPINLPLHTTTDAQGAYNFASVPVGTYTLLVHQDGFAAYYQTLTVTQGQATVADVTLPAQPQPAGNGTVKGTVTDSSGASVDGALVVVVPLAGPLASSGTLVLPTIRSLHTITDASGAFELDNVPAGDYLVFSAKRAVGFARLNTTVTANQTDKLTIDLSSSLPPPMPLKTVNTLVTSTRKAQAAARHAAAVAARKAAQAAKKAAAAAAHAHT